MTLDDEELKEKALKGELYMFFEPVTYEKYAEVRERLDDLEKSVYKLKSDK